MHDTFSEQLDSFATRQLSERYKQAKQFFRRGYSWIDACGNSGLDAEEYPYAECVTVEDEKYHDAVWGGDWK